MKFGEIMKHLRGLTHSGREAERKEKLEKLFQLNNNLVHRKTGTKFTVCEVSTGQAMLIDAEGSPMITSWFTAAGRLKTEMADSWDLAPA